MPDTRRSPLLSVLTLAALLTGAAMAQTGAVRGDPTTYTVRPGDTAYSVARSAGMTVDALLGLNSLTASDLKVGQVLRLTPAAQAVSAAPAVPVRRTAPHTVAAGETAYSIARAAGMTVDALLGLNNLTGGDLKVGQVVQVAGAGDPVPTPPPRLPAAPRFSVSPRPTLRAAGAGSSTPTFGTVSFTAGRPLPAVTLRLTPAGLTPTSLTIVPLPAPVPPADLPDTPAAPSDWRGTAMSLLGVPYVYGGSTRSGLDCSGLVRLTFPGLHLPRQSTEQARAGQAVDAGDLQAGDLLFWDTEGQGAVTHVGIYLGGGTFIHANSYAGQVSISRVDERYYAQRFLGARRVLPASAQGN